MNACCQRDAQGAHLAGHAHVAEEALVGCPEGSPQRAALLAVGGAHASPLAGPQLLQSKQELSAQGAPHARSLPVHVGHARLQLSLHHLKVRACMPCGRCQHSRAQSRAGCMGEPAVSHAQLDQHGNVQQQCVCGSADCSSMLLGEAAGGMLVQHALH